MCTCDVSQAAMLPGSLHGAGSHCGCQMPTQIPFKLRQGSLREAVAAQVIHLKAERDVLRMVNHPGLVNMLGAFQDAVCVYFVMEYVCGGEFFRQLRIREKYGRNCVQPAHVCTCNDYPCTVHFLCGKGASPGRLVVCSVHSEGASPVLLCLADCQRMLLDSMAHR